MKDRFGFGFDDQEHEIQPEVIEAVEQDFGEKFGTDLSLLVLEHYKATGELLTTQDIGEDTVKYLKDKYMDNVVNPVDKFGY